ncbi:peritrophin-44 [Haematobia irritans]|uniref:peritrophin-44 n=1 Tax=Haematobia irritans TaxID=7368 RepID=UPI003F50A12C
MFKVCIIAMAFVALATGKSLTNDDSTPTVQELCALLPGATILRPNTCTNWIKCPTSSDSSDFEEGSCVYGLYFNKDKGMCMYKDEMECPYENSAPSGNRCSRQLEGAFLADEDNCHGYVYCKNGEEMKSECPNNLVFDPHHGECVYEHQYSCPAAKAVEKRNPICMSLPNDVFFADQEDCLKYSHCLDGVLTSHECGEDQAWDHIKGICVATSEVVCLPTAKKPEPENEVCGSKTTVRVGPISDGVSCSGYYFCKKMENGQRDRKPEHFTCNAGYFFDNSTLSCRDRLNVKCSHDRCEGMDNKYVNVAGNCRAYASCANGEAVFKGNCPDNYFFDERTQGCTPQVVSYAACSA